MSSLCRFLREEFSWTNLVLFYYELDRDSETSKAKTEAVTQSLMTSAGTPNPSKMLYLEAVRINYGNTNPL